MRRINENGINIQILKLQFTFQAFTSLTSSGISAESSVQILVSFLILASLLLYLKNN
jgi:hypothetical protein